MTHRIAVIGTGIFATQKHLPAIEKTPQLELVGAFNRTKAKAEAFVAEAEKSRSGSAADHKVAVFDSIDAIMADPNVDVVDALLPVEQNLSIVEASLRAGKPISIEKPIAATLEDAAAIVRLAESSKVPVMVLENWCYHHGTLKLQELLPQLGAISHFSLQASGPFRLTPYHGTAWRQQPKHIGGFLSDAGVHDLALLTEVLGPIGSVGARTAQTQAASGAVDTLSAVLQLQSGAFGTYTQSRYTGPGPAVLSLQIFGANGTLIYERPSPAGGSIRHYAKVGDETKVEETKLGEDELNGVVAEFANWAEVLADGNTKRLVSTPRRAFHHYAAVAAAVRSGERNGEVVGVAKVEDFA